MQSRFVILSPHRTVSISGYHSAGLSFVALATWVTVHAARSLLAGGDADSSPAGIGLAAASLLVMPLLVRAKRRTGRELGSATVMADSTQTMLCTYLSAVLLVGLGLNALWGWSWADPIAALVIAGVAVKEGVEAWRGEHCDDCTPLPVVAVAAGQPAGCADDCCADRKA
jgi:divalent metal cation (Fe/Co/Zn/Cd) transporter